MKILIRVLIIVITAVFAACNHKEFYDDNPTIKIRVVFDWTDAPDANPEGMCVFFYPTDGTDAPSRRFDFSGLNGGEIEIKAGKYKVLFYNNDTEAVQLRGTDGFDSHEGFTREGNLLEPLYGSGANYVPRAEGTEGERVVICPDMLWGCSAPQTEILGDRDQVITLKPHELVCHYSYEVRNVKNLKHVVQMSGSLSSMSPSLFIGQEELHRECVTIPFESISDGESRITGQFLTFGHHEANEDPHKMVIYAWFNNGEKYYYTYDVTDQIHSAPDKRHVHLILDGLEFPEPIENGSGFHPSVDGWITVDQDIIM